MILRSYQQQAIQKARQSFSNGNKDIALVLATGAGKSIITKKIVEAFREKNKTGKIGYFTFRTVLINQMKETLKGLDVEIDTLQSKPSGDYDFIIVDEVHYARNSKLQNNLKAKWKLGLTATPITPAGFALAFDDLIDIVQLKDLIDMGYAAPVKVLSTSNIDTSTLKITAGDYNQKQSLDLMSKSKVKKNIVDVYKKYAKGLKTIIYCVNIQHCEDMEQEFKQNGIHCESIHSRKKDTDKALENFKNNRTKVLINADMLTTGVDLPDIYCLILAAPTKSLIKSTQIYGRATRLNPSDPNKTALIIDCANVIQDTQHPYQKFDFTKTKKEKFTPCPKCKNKMNLTNRRLETISDFEYKVISDYSCSCGENLTIENIKLVNIEICDGCGNQFKSVGGLNLNKKDKSLNFNLVCECGHEKKFREIILSDDELKEISLHEAIESGSTWKDVEIILKNLCKNNNYHWRYSLRLIDTCKKKQYTPKITIGKIKQIVKNGDKISKLSYI